MLISRLVPSRAWLQSPLGCDAMHEGSLDLRFGPGSASGFTPSGLAGFSDLRPAAVVRELIQNSLDAAVEAGVPTATVRFRLTRCKRRDVPGIESHSKAFWAAARTHEDFGGGSLPSQAERVVQVVSDALKKKEQDILAVLDNGIGLDPTKMTALLSDGVSAKGGTATGTFGNGHTVAIPASNLRYILYGGVTGDGTRIGSGHAVLASSVKPLQRYQTSADGFLVNGFQNGSYEFSNGDSLPDLIAGNLDEIERIAGHGTAVIITAFNNFRRKAPLWDMVSKAAACNFFPAISQGRLIVQVEDCRPGQSGALKVLDASTLRAVLEANREEKRSSAFLSGHRAFDAHEALRIGRGYAFETELGKLQIRIRELSSGTSRVDLFRNGMWITEGKNLPRFYYAFQDRKPFHALLLLDSSSGERLHELVRNAEGPLHDKLDIKQRLLKPEAKQLRAAFDEIREWLRSVVPEIGSSSYSPDDFLALDFGGDGAGGKSQRSFWGSPVTVTRRDPAYTYGERLPLPGKGTGGEGKPKAGDQSEKPRPRPVLRPQFRVASIPLDGARRRIHLECQEDCKDAELRLCLDENVDATCDSLRRDEIETVDLTRVYVGGQLRNGSELVRQDGRVVGVLLGDLAANESLDIEVSYKLPSGYLALPGQQPALRVEVFRSPPSTTEGA